MASQSCFSGNTCATLYPILFKRKRAIKKTDETYAWAYNLRLVAESLDHRKDSAEDSGEGPCSDHALLYINCIDKMEQNSRERGPA